MRVAVIGLGSMGMGAALNLIKHGHDVQGCDVRAAAMTELEAAGGVGVAQPDALAADRAAIVLFVVNAAQVQDVLFGPTGCAGRLAPGSVMLCCTTMAPDAITALAARLEPLGLLLLDAPVSGGAVGARAGTMTVMAAGPPAAFARGRAGAGGDGGQGVAARRCGRHRQHRQDGQPAARRRAYRDRRRGAGARHPRRRRPAGAVRGDLLLRRQFVDVAEPGAAHPGRATTRRSRRSTSSSRISASCSTRRGH